jgi:mRNA interferase MazF
LFPNSDLRTAKLRPAIVIQSDGLNTGLPQVIVAMITSNQQRANHLSRVAVSIATAEGQASGLVTDSVIMTDDIATVLSSEINRVIGRLTMVDVNAALKHTLGL